HAARGAHTDGRAGERERAERDALDVAQVHDAAADEPRLRPSGDERIAILPVDLERQLIDWARDHRVAAEPHGERQSIEEWPRQIEIDVIGLEIDIAHAHEP